MAGPTGSAVIHSRSKASRVFGGSLRYAEASQTRRSPRISQSAAWAGIRRCLNPAMLPREEPGSAEAHDSARNSATSSVPRISTRVSDAREYSSMDPLVS